MLRSIQALLIASHWTDLLKIFVQFSSLRLNNHLDSSNQNETVEIGGNDSFVDDVAHPTSGPSAAQPENLDAENENDQDLSVEAEPPMEQAVSSSPVP